MVVTGDTTAVPLRTQQQQQQQRAAAAAEVEALDGEEVLMLALNPKQTWMDTRNWLKRTRPALPAGLQMGPSTSSRRYRSRITLQCKCLAAAAEAVAAALDLAVDCRAEHMLPRLLLPLPPVMLVLVRVRVSAWWLLLMCTAKLTRGYRNALGVISKHPTSLGIERCARLRSAD